MRRAFRAPTLALLALFSGCGPLFPLPPETRPDGATTEPGDAPADDAAAFDASVCIYPLRTGCTGSGGCMGYRECDPTETFLGPCTCYPDAGWDRPPVVDRGEVGDAAQVDVAAVVDAGPSPDVVSSEDRPVTQDAPDVADAGPAHDAGLSPSYCVAHPVGCTSNRECEACGATPGGVGFCCSTMTTVCLLRSVTRGCMP